MKEREKRLPNGLMHELNKFYYDTAQANHPGALAALLKLAPLSQILYGTDYPFWTGAEENEGHEGLRKRRPKPPSRCRRLRRSQQKPTKPISLPTPRLGTPARPRSLAHLPAKERARHLRQKHDLK